MPRGVYYRDVYSKHANCRGDHLELFFRRVDKMGPYPGKKGRWCLTTRCWIWLAGKYANSGYGQFRGTRAHKYIYEIVVGKVLDGMLVMHKCDNPSCVNPDHLFMGTPADNMEDKVRKGRQSRVGCSKNPPIGERNIKAKLTEKQVVLARELYRNGVSIKNIETTIQSNVCKSTLLLAVRKRTWRHLA